MSALINTATGWRTYLRDTIAMRPLIYYPLYRMFRSRRHGLVDHGTQITIEGFPRSANSFAVEAFLQANPSVAVAHHMHAPAQIIRSIQLDIPTLVLIRKPEAVLRSLLVYRSGLHVSTAAQSYSRFYEAILPLLDQLVLATFSEVITDYGRVIQAINTRYGTAFHTFMHNLDSRREVLSGVSGIRRGSGDPEVRARRVAVPTPAREEMKSKVQIEHTASFLRAHRVYEVLLEQRHMPQQPQP